MSRIDGMKSGRKAMMRLLRDVRGATLPIIGVALITLTALIGSGVDISRIYLTKTRLQQACDAGALAGRKAMGVNSWTTGTGSPDATANAMFSGNFKQGDYGTGTLTKSYSESDGSVTGNASAVVPMAIMKVFGIATRSLSVTCTAKMAIPNTDVMFVLDVTGSMSDYISGESTTKITGLKKAVKCFYEALERVNTTAVCGNDPSATSYSGTAQIRMGFVPYSVNANVGRLLPNSYFADNWSYQTRVATYSKSGNFKSWTYQLASLDVSGLKAGGSSWNSSVTLPVGSRGTDVNAVWDGCIEERQTVKNSDGDPSDEWDPIPSDAYDMNINMLPSSTSGTQWGPILDSTVYPRYTQSCNKWGSCSNTATTDTVSVDKGDSLEDMQGASSASCPTAAKKLQTWTTSSPFETYVNSLSPTGNTYHDIGMLWGARLISPTGMFATENTNLTNIQRHVIFMTDGDTNTGNTNYTAYGIGWWDRRQTTYAPSNTNLNNLVNARLQALCKSIKNMNITLWVISYGADINATTGASLQTCASTGKYYSASSTSSLISQFQQIASDISQLRLTN